MYFDNGLPADISRELIDLCEGDAYEHNNVQWYTEFPKELLDKVTTYVQQAIGDYCALVPKYVLKGINPAGCEFESLAVKRIGKEGEPEFFDNYGTSKRRLVILFHLNTVKGSGINFEQAGIKAEQKEGHVTIAPFSWLYSYTVDPADEEQYVMITHLRLKDEAAKL